MNFLNIGKANAEIERLKSELSQKDAELKAHLENAAELEKAAEKTQQDSEKASKAQSERIQDLEKQVADYKAAAEKAKADAEAHCKDFDAKVAKVAADKALQVTASQGQPPIPTTPAVVPAAEQKPAVKGLKKTELAFAAQLKNFKA
jgi:dsDNA-specific endonuclease/ATPase MutS2